MWKGMREISDKDDIMKKRKMPETGPSHHKKYYIVFYWF
jgi:hypothetical protein